MATEDPLNLVFVDQMEQGQRLGLEVKWMEELLWSNNYSEKKKSLKEMGDRWER